MNYVLQKLEEERERAIAELRSGHREFLMVKQKLEWSISCLQFCEQFGLFDGKDQPAVLELPAGERGGWTRWRLMDDCETNDRNEWKEGKHNGKPVILAPGDIIIMK